MTEPSYASVDSSSTKSKGEPSLLEVSGRLWRPLIVVFAYYLLTFERSDLIGAYFRTRIECGPVVATAKGCPRGSFAGADGSCQAVPNTSPLWSGSAHCASQFQVVAAATALGGRMSSVACLCGLIAQVVVGSALVDTWGRRPVMLLGLVSNLVLTALIFISSLGGNAAFVPLVFTGIVLCSLTNAFPAASLSMASDISQGTVERGLGYNAIFAVQHVGIAAAFAAGFFVLACNLTDYSRVWAVVLVFSVLACGMSWLLLPETLKTGEKAALLKKAQPQTLWGSTAAAFNIVWQDTFLRRSFVLDFFRTMALIGALHITGSYAISVIGLTQAVASLAGVVGPASRIVGSVWASWFLKKFGPWPTFFIGEALVPLGQIAVGAAAHLPASAAYLYWTGWLLQGFGAGMATSSHLAIVSVRVPDENEHGKLFSAFSFMGTIASMVGMLVWTNVLFTRKSMEEGRAGSPYFISAAMQFLAELGYVALWATLIRHERREESLETTL